MKQSSNLKEQYFMDDTREGKRLEIKVNADEFVEIFLKPHLDHYSAANILEAGCGPGSFLHVIGKNYPSHNIIGIDISEERIAQANKKSSDIHNVKAITADIYHLPFPDNHFDFIYSRFLFEYLSSPIEAAKELHRVCKPCGKMLLQDLDGQFIFYPELSPLLQKTLTQLKEQTGFDPNIGRKLFHIGKSAGFTFIDIKTQLYHQFFGKIDEFNLMLWKLKLDIAFNNIMFINHEDSVKLKEEILSSLQDENTISFSTLFTATFQKIHNA